VKVLSLFSGIGGLDLAAEWAGMEVVAFCEIEDYPVRVLKRRWSDVPVFGDVSALTGNTLRERGIRPEGIDCIVGGFPCQPFSVAGKRKGKDDERFLWGEFSRLIEEIGPSWVVAENVPGLIGIALDDVLADLEGKGYGCLPFVYPASAVGAPHRRERVFIVAHNSKQGLQGGEASRNNVTNRPEPLDELAPRCCAGNLWPTPDCSDRRSAKSKQQGLSNAVGVSLNPDWVEILMGFDIGWTDIYCDEPVQWPGWPAMMRIDQHYYEPPRTTKGGKNRAKRLKALGNAVVPQQAYPIFRAIMEVEA
jgi:DNA (cytosine-5)-methyltransferase 1